MPVVIVGVDENCQDMECLIVCGILCWHSFETQHILEVQSYLNSAQALHPSPRVLNPGE